MVRGVKRTDSDKAMRAEVKGSSPVSPYTKEKMVHEELGATLGTIDLRHEPSLRARRKARPDLTDHELRVPGSEDPAEGYSGGKIPEFRISLGHEIRVPWKSQRWSRKPQPNTIIVLSESALDYTHAPFIQELPDDKSKNKHYRR